MKLYTSVVKGSNAVINTLVEGSVTVSEMVGEEGIRPVIRSGMRVMQVNMEHEVEISIVNNSHRLELAKLENTIEYRREKIRLNAELAKLKEEV